MLECLSTSPKKSLTWNVPSLVCVWTWCVCVWVRECDRPERSKKEIFQTKIRATARMLEVEELIAFPHPQG